MEIKIKHIVYIILSLIILYFDYKFIYNASNGLLNTSGNNFINIIGCTTSLLSFIVILIILIKYLIDNWDKKIKINLNKYK